MVSQSTFSCSGPLSVTSQFFDLCWKAEIRKTTNAVHLAITSTPDRMMASSNCFGYLPYLVAVATVNDGE